MKLQTIIFSIATNSERLLYMDFVTLMLRVFALRTVYESWFSSVHPSYIHYSQNIPVDVLFTTVVKWKVLENFSIHIFQGKGSDAMYYLRWECMYEGNLDTREGGNVYIDVFHSNFSLTVGFEELQFGQCNDGTLCK